jgi:hypothetical protein
LGTLCQHPNIKKRAKYKPVKWNKDATLNRDGVSGLSVYINDDSHDYWKGNDGMCGLNIPVYTTVSAITTAYKNGTIKDIAFDPPVAGTNPFRLTDFEGYNHSVPNDDKFFSMLVSTRAGRNGSNYQLDQYSHLDISIYLDKSELADILNYTDLQVDLTSSGGSGTVTLDKFRWFAYLFGPRADNGKTVTMRIWSDKLIGDSEYQDVAQLDFANVEVGSVYAGTYKVAIFAIYQSSWSSSASNAEQAYCVPAMLSKEFTLTDYAVGTYASILSLSNNLDFSVTGNQVSGNVYINFGLINTSDAEVPVTIEKVIIGDENTNDTSLQFKDVETDQLTKTIKTPKGSVNSYQEVTCQFYKNYDWEIDKEYNLYIIINICGYGENGKLYVCNSWTGDLRFKIKRGTSKYLTQMTSAQPFDYPDEI